MILSISEILRHTSELPTQKEKIDYLRKHDHMVLRVILKCAFDPDAKFELPPGRPAGHKKTGYLEAQGVLYKQLPAFLDLLQGRATHLSPKKKELRFAAILEIVDPEDAELLIHVKDKQIPYEGITPELINEAFGPL